MKNFVKNQRFVQKSKFFPKVLKKSVKMEQSRKISRDQFYYIIDERQKMFKTII